MQFTFTLIIDEDKRDVHGDEPEIRFHIQQYSFFFLLHWYLWKFKQYQRCFEDLRTSASADVKNSKFHLTVLPN